VAAEHIRRGRGPLNRTHLSCNRLNRNRGTIRDLPRDRTTDPPCLTLQKTMSAEASV